MHVMDPRQYVTITIDPPLQNISSLASMLNICELDIGTILERSDQMQAVFAKFDENEDAKYKREQQASIIGYLAAFFSAASIVLWIISKCVATEDQSIVDKFQTAAFIASFLSYAAYAFRRTPPNGWPI